MEMVVVVAAGAVEVEVVEVVAEECHHHDLGEWDMGHPSLHMWTANYTAKVLTSLQETNERPASLLPSGTSTGASTLMQ